MHLGLLTQIQTGLFVLFLKPLRELQGKCFRTLTCITTTDLKNLAALQAGLLRDLDADLPYSEAPAEEQKEEAQNPVLKVEKEIAKGNNGTILQTRNRKELRKLMCAYKEFIQVCASASLVSSLQFALFFVKPQFMNYFVYKKQTG